MNETHGEFSVLSLILNASFGIQFIMLILLFYSLVSWKIIFEYSYKIKKAEIEHKNFLKKINNGKNNTLKKIFSELKHEKINNIFGIKYIFLKSFSFLNESSLLNGKRIKKEMNLLKYEFELIDIFKETFNAEMDKVDSGLKHKLSLLGTISSTAPYIGLLGTVYGILIAFWGLGTEHQATIAIVAPSIAEALIATAMGLFVAIPALIAYNRLNHRVDTLINNYNKISENSKTLLKKQAIQHICKED